MHAKKGKKVIDQEYPEQLEHRVHPLGMCHHSSKNSTPFHKSRQELAELQLIPHRRVQGMLLVLLETLSCDSASTIFPHQVTLGIGWM